MCESGGDVREENSTCGILKNNLRMIVMFWPFDPAQKRYFKVIHRKEVTHSKASNRKKTRGRIKAYDMGQGEGPIVPLQWCTGRK